MIFNWITLYWIYTWYTKYISLDDIYSSGIHVEFHFNGTGIHLYFTGYKFPLMVHTVIAAV